MECLRRVGIIFVIVLIFIFTTTGCATNLNVEAPPEVEVISATATKDALKIDLICSKSGLLNISTSYAYGGGNVQRIMNITFDKRVVADEVTNIDIPLDLPKGKWGTLKITWEK